MRSHQKLARLGGLSYLLTFASSIPAVLLLQPMLDQQSWVLQGSSGRALLGCLLDVVNAGACVATAVVLYPTTRQHSRVASIGFITSRLYEAAVILIGVISLLTVITIRRDLAGSISTPQTWRAVSATLVKLRDWTFLLGPTLAASINAFLLGSVLRKARLVPSAITGLARVGAPLLLASVVLDLMNGNHRNTTVAAIATAPIFLWELSLGLFLTLKGVRQSDVEPPAAADGLTFKLTELQS